MAHFQSWNDWISLRESNARKRAVKAALNGTGPALPGSYATCPSTNVKAMKVAKKTGLVKEEKKPDYSFDRWINMAKDLGDDVNKMVGHGKEEEEKIEKEPVKEDPKKPSLNTKEKPEKLDKKDSIEDKEKSSLSTKERPEKIDKEDSIEGKEDTWEKLKKISKDFSSKNKKEAKDLKKDSKKQ
jgi:hypothetical protein